MEIETIVNESIPSTENETESTETEMESHEEASAETKETAEEVKATDTEEEKPRVPKIPIEAPKNNGVATPAAAPAKPKQLAGVIVQFPEMFSLKRDAHFLQKFEDASDIKMQRIAYIECESEEAATTLHKKLNGETLNSKKVTASRLDLTEKNVLYVNGIKRETTDDMVKETFEGILQMRRESYNTYILFGSEAEARAAKAKMNKDGVSGSRVHCEFDNRGKDRFHVEEPAAKKAKLDEEASKAEETTPEENEDEEEDKTEETEAGKEEEDAMEEGGETEQAEEDPVEEAAEETTEDQ